MTRIFLDIFNLSISAGWLVLAVLLVRLLFKNAPKWANVLLWGIVALRLVLPFSLESALSLIPSAQTIPPSVLTEGPSFQIQSGIPSVDTPVNAYLRAHYYEGVTVPVGQTLDTLSLVTTVWLVGVIALLLYTLLSYLRLRHQVATATRLRDNLYQSEFVSSPFILGILFPKIYLPYHLDAQAQAHVIAHEQAHLRRRDHWWKPLGFVLLAVYWFHPLLWLAYILLCRDIELACDEAVIQELTPNGRADYSQALLACSTGRLRIAACPLAFGEVGVKDRVKSVLHYKKPGFWIMALAVVLCLIVAVCFLTVPSSDDYFLLRSGLDRERRAIYELSLGNRVQGGRVIVEQWEDGKCTQVGTMDLTPDMEMIQIEAEKLHSSGQFMVYLSQGHGMECVSHITFPQAYDTWGASIQVLHKKQVLSPDSSHYLLCITPGYANRTDAVYSCDYLEDHPEVLQTGSHILVRAEFTDTPVATLENLQFTVAEILCQPVHLSTTYPVSQAPSFAIGPDRELLTRQPGETEWTSLGKLRGCNLTKEDFDDQFPVQEAFVSSIRSRCVRAWRPLAHVSPRTVLLQLDDGSFYLAQGADLPDSPDRLDWLYRLTPVPAADPANPPVVATAWVNWTTDPAVMDLAHNREMLIQEEDHLPVFLCESTADLQKFRQDFEGILQFSVMVGDVSSFDHVAAMYDDRFFQDQVLLLVYVPCKSWSYRYGIEALVLQDGTLQVPVVQTEKPHSPEEPLGGWMLGVPVDRDRTQTIENYDAILK